MSYQTISIKDAVHRINHSVDGWFLPAIQRPYVWGSRYQSTNYICRLFDSLLRGYPIGSLIIWKTSAAVPYREFMQDYVPGEFPQLVDQGLYSRADKWLVVDGQQRLQTLFSGLRYTCNHQVLVYDLLFDLNAPHPSGETGFFFIAKNAAIPWHCLRMNTLFAKHPDENQSAFTQSILDLSENLSADDREIISKNMDLLWKIFVRNDGQSLVYCMVKTDDVSVVNEIFERLNTGGMALSQADLLFSKIKAVDCAFEETLQHYSQHINTLTGNGSLCNAYQILQVIHLIIKGTARIDPAHITSSELALFRTTGETLKEPLLAFFCDYLWGQFKINHSSIIPKPFALLPLILYFNEAYRKGFQFKHFTPNHLLSLHQYFIKSQVLDWTLQSYIDFGAREVMRVSATSTGLMEFPLHALETFIGQRQQRNTVVCEQSLTAYPWFALKILMPGRVYRFASNQRGRFNPEIDHLFPRNLANPPADYAQWVDTLWNLQPVKGDINRIKADLHPRRFFMDLAVNSAGEKIIGSKYVADYDFLFPFDNPAWESPLDFIQQRRRLMIAFIETQYGIELKTTGDSK